MKVKITVMRKTEYIDLMEKYENKIEHACDLKVNEVYYTDGNKPNNFCESAWQTLFPFIQELLNGGGNFFDGWMKNEKSAMLSCNDGFRPVSFLIELVND